MESTTGYVSEENSDDPARDISESTDELAAAIDELEIVYEKLSREPVEVDVFLDDEVQLKKLISFGWKLTRDSEAAMELAHEAIAKSLPKLRGDPLPPGKIVKYLKRTMINTHYTQLRKKRRERDRGYYGDGLTVRVDGKEESIDVKDDSHGLPAGVSLQEASMMRHDLEERIVSAMRKLPVDQQNVLALALGLHKDYPDRFFTQTEIAKFLGITLDLVKSRWRQGTASVRASLEDFWDDWKRS